MHRRPLAPDRSAGADRDGGAERRHHTLLERDPPAFEDARLDDIGNALRPRAGLKKAH